MGQCLSIKITLFVALIVPTAFPPVLIIARGMQLQKQSWKRRRKPVMRLPAGNGGRYAAAFTRQGGI